MSTKYWYMPEVPENMLDKLYKRAINYPFDYRTLATKYSLMGLDINETPWYDYDLLEADRKRNAPANQVLDPTFVGIYYPDGEATTYEWVLYSLNEPEPGDSNAGYQLRVFAFVVWQMYGLGQAMSILARAKFKYFGRPTKQKGN